MSHNAFDKMPPLVGLSSKLPGKYKTKLTLLKNTIKETLFENLALCDEVCEMQDLILIRNEERKFLLKKLCQIEPAVEAEVQKLISLTFPQLSNSNTNASSNKKGKKKPNDGGDPKPAKSRKTSGKIHKKFVQLIPLDQAGRPIFPITLGNLTIHSLGEVISDRPEFHCEDAIFPVGYVSTRIYGSIKDPTTKCIYTCKISDSNGSPRFEIAPDNDHASTIIGSSPDLCHSMLLQQINDALSLNVVSIRPRGNDFFGLTHPALLNLIQSSPGTRKCANYKWSKFEVSKNGDHYTESADTCLSFDSLQNSINYCKFKMTSDILPQTSENILESKSSFSDYYV
ncbi:hypothetical protein FQR65_LT08610 [Abscondita terminalis]|nr:hypothetical protein FQR65_LT08610 [Abscondita terminalis]